LSLHVLGSIGTRAVPHLPGARVGLLEEVLERSPFEIVEQSVVVRVRIGDAGDSSWRNEDRAAGQETGLEEGAPRNAVVAEHGDVLGPAGRG